TPVAAVATPVSPAALRNSRRFMGFPPQQSWAVGAMLLPMYRFVITNNARVETLSIHSRVRHFGLVDRSSPGIRTINAAPTKPTERERAQDTKCREGAGRAVATRVRPEPNHERVVAVFGNLPPEVCFIAEGLHRIQYLLEVGIDRGGLSVHLVGCLEGSFHDRLRERPQLGAAGNELTQGAGIAGIVSA